MAGDTVTIETDPTHSSNYDEYGVYGGAGQTTSSGGGFFLGGPPQIAFATFDAAAIEAKAAGYEQAGWVVTVDLDYQVSTGNAGAHTVTTYAGYYGNIGYQEKVEADQTDQSGPGMSQPAYVYDDLYGAGEHSEYTRTTSFGPAGLGTLTATYTDDISGPIADAAAAGRDLVVTLVENTASEDILVSPNITITAVRGANPPTITGTEADQRVIAGGADTPFSTVRLGDSANPSGAGDDVSITILDPHGNGTDAYGALRGAGLTSFGGGQYELAPAASLAALQSELDALAFTAAPGAGGDRAIFELDLQSAAGSSADDQTTSVDIETVCFLAGTAIATPDGERPIETLRAGDLVLTADGTAAPVRWLGRQTVATRFADPARVAPIRIRAGALAPGLPTRDLLVSPDHALMVGGVFVQAGALVNGVTITREDAALPAHFTYFHVELATHALILAEGVPAETFIDNVDRLRFDNWDEHAQLADAAPLAEMAHPRAKAHRQVPASLRAKLWARAAAIGESAAAA